MELAIFIITLIILSETTVLVLKSRKRPLITTNQKRKVYVDTSSLMDPRFIEVAKTGFIGDDIVIPRSVTNELQLLADGKDSEKRLRARAGLDTVRELERIVFFNTTILNDELDRTPVDNRLMELAKANHGLILTNDYNLAKVAATEHIDTLNLNALALTLRNQYLPGERAKVKIVAAGSNPHQGVAYLRDGTMVVVDHASEKLGQEVEVEFIRLNQTASGTMLFAKLNNPAARSSSSEAGKDAPKSPDSSTKDGPAKDGATRDNTAKDNSAKDSLQKDNTKDHFTKSSSVSSKSASSKRTFPKLPSRHHPTKSDKLKKRHRR